MTDDMRAMLVHVRGHRRSIGELAELAVHDGMCPDRARNAVACLIDRGYARLTASLNVTEAA